MFTSGYRNYGKRLFDLGLVFSALLLLAPLIAAVALLVRLQLGTPVLYRQQRPGLHGQPFTMFKFRTMSDLRDAEGQLLPDAARLTPLGKLLRRLSLDELPTLFNVLKGEMSIVGPRPLLIRYLERYTPEQARRHEVLPGITGLAQIAGRNFVAWEERFALDVRYVDNLSLWLDCKIIASTIIAVLFHTGVIEEGDLIDFWGSQGPPSEGPLALPVEQDETNLLERV